jgi:hypothetical protein
LVQYVGYCFHARRAMEALWELEPLLLPAHPPKKCVPVAGRTGWPCRLHRRPCGASPGGARVSSAGPQVATAGATKEITPAAGDGTPFRPGAGIPALRILSLDYAVGILLPRVGDVNGSSDKCGAPMLMRFPSLGPKRHRVCPRFLPLLRELHPEL